VYHDGPSYDGGLAYSSVYTVTGAYMQWSYPGGSGPTDFTIEIATQSTYYVTYASSSGHAGPLNFNHPGQANYRSFCDWRYNLGNDPNVEDTKCEVKH
jgi:hypothetical protein